MSEILKNTIWGESRVDGKYDYLINPKTIFNFLTKSDKRIVPEYQRPYSWEKRNIEKLLEDIWNCSRKTKPWYLGTIYSTKKGAGENESSQVLDGQQRLTTIQLILNEFLIFFKLNDQIDYDAIDDEITYDLEQYKKDSYSCLISRSNGQSQQRFQTETITNKLLKQYILETEKASTKRKLVEKLNEIDSQLEDTGISSKTAKTLRSSIEIVRRFYEKLVFSDASAADGKKDIEKGLDDLRSFIEALLHKLWVIEVPLVDEELSLEIFEGINNRGKQLDLLDKLQFRSLTKIEGHGSEIKASWKDLYTKVENLISDSSSITTLFSNHTEFYKTFFLGINGKEESDPDVVVNNFERKFLNDYAGLEAFFKHVNSAITLFQAIQSPLNNRLVSKFPSHQKTSVKGLLQVTRRTIIESKQSRQLIINISYHFDATVDANGYPIVQSLWNVIRLVYLKSVVRNEKPQSIRNDFNKIIRYANDDNTIYIRLLKALFEYTDTDDSSESDDDSTHDSSESEGQSNNPLFELKGVIQDNDGKFIIPTVNLFSPGLSMLKSSSTGPGNKTAKLIQYYIIKRFNCNSLEVKSEQIYAKEELEHVFPLSYKQHWSDKTYTKDELVTKAEEILERLNYTWDSELIMDQIKKEEEVILHNYSQKPSNSNETSLIEWHGNKIILGKRPNGRKKNKSYEDKLRMDFEDANQLVAPIHQNDFGTGDSWGMEEILERSFKVLFYFSRNLLNEAWDNDLS